MKRVVSIGVAVLLAAAANLHAAEGNLLGDWAGLRPAMEEKGLTAEAVLTTDFLYNTSGGIRKRGTILGNVDVTLKLDTDKAGWWKNGTFFLYFLGNFNSNGPMTEIVGDVQASSNIEADSKFKLYEAWYEHRFSGDRFSVLGGLHDYNSEFDVVEYGSLFINSSFGIAPDISQTGPSIFPTTSLGLRLKAQPTEKSYLLAALYDGVPGDPHDPPRTAVILKEEDGVFAAFEAGMSAGQPGEKDYYKLGAGAWLHTAEVENFDGHPKGTNHGYYLIAEKTLFAESAAGQGLGGFAQVGWADDDWNQIAYYWGMGLNYTGLIPGRDRDSAGIAVGSARNGNKFMDFRSNVEGAPVERSETAIEVTYRAEVFPGVVVQPDFQYIVNPGMDPSLNNAFQIGSRVEIAF
ncbi:carbohydrate porin [Geobacter sp. DSM 9736]|uniref:carbohydrate porin n=1 Tax=Geobacter sp. DSM 9736 TaxID=1277350 RepID=UPI000B5065CF|nr:carbohydrate porin [Geobacter sp. DSM 9736]SNB44765.1 porin [Geobacter sp. DSM 9736]